MPKRRSREPEFDLVEIPPVRQAIGDRVATSRREKPTFIMTVQVRGDAMVAARAKCKAEAGERVLPTFNDIVIKAVGDLLPTHRHLNAWVAEEGIRQIKPINVGFAAATPQGVVLPTVFDVDQKTVWDIAPDTKEMVDLARNGKLRASLTMGAGFTVSNIGPAGIDSFDAIISPPQVAILAVGSMTLRPVVDGGWGWRPGQASSDYAIVAAPTMNLSLTVDHRAIDGAEAAPFLSELRDKLENWDA